MATINETFLEHHGSTDVITFDHAGYLKLEPPTSGQRPAARHLYGEIFLSVPDAIRHAKEFNTTWQSEVTRYVIHGLLHLTGHDDLNPAARRIMKREENKLVTR